MFDRIAERRADLIAADIALHDGDKLARRLVGEDGHRVVGCRWEVEARRVDFDAEDRDVSNAGTVEDQRVPVEHDLLVEMHARDVARERDRRHERHPPG